MKKFINILLIIISIISFTIFFKITDSQQKNATIYAENQENSFRILIPDSINDSNKTYAYNKIISIADKYNANLYTTHIETNNNATLYKKYIYLNDSSYFNTFKTKDNSILDFSMLKNGYYFSTDNSNNDPNQIATILDFANNDSLEIHSLEDNPVLSGFYIVSIKDQTSFDSFINDLSSSLSIPIVQSSKPVVIANYSLEEFCVIFLLYMLIILLLIYNILNSYKKIGIYKLLGIDNKKIWLSYIYPITLKIGVFFILSSLILTFLYSKGANSLLYKFLIETVIVDIILMFCSFVLLSIPFLILKIFSLTSILKNNRPTKSILIVNTIIKVFISVICICTFSYIYSNYRGVNNFFNKSYKSWENTKNYFIFPHLLNFSEKMGEGDKLTELNKELYYTFNKTGSILANFKLYSESYTNTKSSGAYSKAFEKYAMINPNYLNENPVYDTENNRIYINEEEKNFIMLIPEKYKNLEKDIVDYIKKYTYESYKINDSEELKIIWISNDQKLFSYNIAVSPENGNFVRDPFCLVVTENNCNDRAYRQVFGFSNAGNPFKIKVDNIESADTFIRPTLKKFNINENLPDIVSVYDSVSTEIANITNSIKILSGCLISLLFLLTLITIQNVINHYIQNKQIIIIKNLYGYSVKDKYGNFFKKLIFTSLIVTFLSIIILSFNFETIKIVVFMSIILFILESLIALIAFKYIEIKNIVTVSKGGE